MNKIEITINYISNLQNACNNGHLYFLMQIIGDVMFHNHLTIIKQNGMGIYYLR